MPMLSFLGANHPLPLFHMAKSFIWLNKKKHIKEFKNRYMVNPNLNINKTFIEQVEKCMKITFGAITQHFIRALFLKKKTRVLTLIMFYETRVENIAYRLLNCVIYTMIKNHVCIEYLAYQ